MGAQSLLHSCKQALKPVLIIIKVEFISSILTHDNTQVYDLPRRQYTIPQPFTFHTGSAAHKATAPEKTAVKKKKKAAPVPAPSSPTTVNESENTSKVLDSCSTMSICTSSVEKRELE